MKYLITLVLVLSVLSCRESAPPRGTVQYVYFHAGRGLDDVVAWTMNQNEFRDVRSGIKALMINGMVTGDELQYKEIYDSIKKIVDAKLHKQNANAVKQKALLWLLIVILDDSVIHRLSLSKRGYIRALSIYEIFNPSRLTYKHIDQVADDGDFMEMWVKIRDEYIEEIERLGSSAKSVGKE